MATAKYIQTPAKAEDLEKGMTIIAYTGFSAAYQSIDAATCKFIRHNFRGTEVTVVRSKQKLELQVDELKIGDALSRIYNFPANLQKITLVTTNLIKELKKRGMVRFLVKKKVGQTSKSKRDLQEIIRQVEASTRSLSSQEPPKPVRKKKVNQSISDVNEFIEKVTECIELRDEMSGLIEQSMDDARKGVMNVAEITTYIKAITKDDSAAALSTIMSLKESDQLYEHSIDVGSIFQTVYLKIIDKKKGASSAFESKEQVMMAALMHDFGKSKIPKEIVDSTHRYSRESKEMDLIKSHPLYGSVMLSDMDMPSAAINMAHFHHVKRDTSMVSSYPVGVEWKEVQYETRLLAIVDIYQAFVGRRKYKRSWSAPSTMRYLDALAGVELDERAWEDFLHIVGVYPLGSMVELNDGSQGFVVSVPPPNEDLERPHVAIIRNGKGEDLSHNDLIDLMELQEMSIVTDLDYADILGNKALDKFSGINLI